MQNSVGIFESIYPAYHFSLEICKPISISVQYPVACSFGAKWVAYCKLDIVSESSMKLSLTYGGHGT